MDEMGIVIVSISLPNDSSILECYYKCKGGIECEAHDGPWGEYNPRPETFPIASAVVHLGSLKAKTSDEHYCMLDSGANVLVIPWLILGVTMFLSRSKRT